MSDGRIIIDTEIDNSGSEKGIKDLRAKAATLAAEYRKLGMSQSEAFTKAWSEIERESGFGSQKVVSDLKQIKEKGVKILMTSLARPWFHTNNYRWCSFKKSELILKVPLLV